MLYKWFLFVLVFTPLFGSSQVLDTMYFDNDWEQTTEPNAHYYRIVSVDTSGDFRFLVEDFYPDGQIQMTGIYKSIRPDNKDGRFTYWYEDGIKQMECNYSDNRLHGVLKEWYASGLHESYQEFSNGIPNGEYTTWREDGSLNLKARYYKGEKHGNFQSYYPNGQMTRDDYFENGKLIEGRCYSEEGESIDYFPFVQMPEFPDGPGGIRRFVEKELIYPQEAKKRGIEGTVIILFTIDEEGLVIDPRVVNGDREYFNEEALRIVNNFPLWTPGEVDGIPSPLQVSVPIEFRMR